MKKCAICGKPAESGLVVHGECVKQDGWIPCSERLPEAGERVLVYYSLDPNSDGGGIGMLDGCVCKDYRSIGVTHWWSLPETPEV